MISTFSLRHKSLALVFLPLFCLVGFVVTLVALINEVTLEVGRESHSRDVILATSKALKQSYHLIYDKDITGEITDETPLEERKKHAAITEREFVGNWTPVFELVKDDNYNQAEFAQLRVVVDKAVESLQAWLAELTKEKPKKGTLHDMAAHVTKTTQMLVKALIAITDLEESRSKQNNSSELISSVKQIFPAALALTTLTAVLLAWFFSTSVRKPLETIAQNSILLSQREQLLAPLTRADELGELDRLIHIVAESVYSALDREQDLLISVGELVCSINEDGEFTYLNPYCRKIFLMEPDQLTGKPLIDFVISDDVMLADQHFSTAKNEEGSTEFELRLLRADGQMTETRWSTFWSPAHQSHFCVVLDITEQKNIERLKQDFVNMVSHDLRSPLMSIHASMTLISAGAKGEISEEVRKSTNDAASAIELLTILVNDLLDFQKLQEGKMQLAISEFELGELLAESISLLEAAARKKNVQIHLKPGQWTVKADQSKLRQTITNFVSNAIKFSPHDGHIWIDVAQERASIEVRVIDQGPGIPEGYEEKIFEAFEQVPSEKQKEGSGLGLAICKLIATAHGGATGVCTKDEAERYKDNALKWKNVRPTGARPTTKDSPSHGSVFWIRIPT